MSRLGALPDLVCFSHLRWDFVFQRPQHLMTRFARERRVFFVEEPIYDDSPPRLVTTTCQSGVRVAVPHLRTGTPPDRAVQQQRRLLDQLMTYEDIDDFVSWYYTPMALEFSRHLAPLACVYDCMDELSHFAGAPPALRKLEEALIASADVIFTGGHSLYEYKRHLHPNMHPVPSSVDVAHFAKARDGRGEPADQASIAHPRLGFFGVVDERFDLDIIGKMAAARPHWQIVIIGPVVKIDQALLPRAANIHYLGGKKYAELPDYVGGWDVALLPFALNDATRFISPTKTPEYLAAGRPVVSTPIRDVERPYGEQGLVSIARGPEAFIAAVEQCLARRDDEARRRAADELLATMSWDATFARMKEHVDAAVELHGMQEEVACSTI